MKKILAIMLIAVIAVAGVFADMNSNPGSVELKYTVKNQFISSVGFTVDGEDYAGTAIPLGSNENGFAKEETGKVIVVYDMSYSNSLNDDTHATYVTLTMPNAWKKGVGEGAVEGPEIKAT